MNFGSVEQISYSALVHLPSLEGWSEGGVGMKEGGDGRSGSCGRRPELHCTGCII